MQIILPSHVNKSGKRDSTVLNCFTVLTPAISLYQSQHKRRMNRAKVHKIKVLNKISQSTLILFQVKTKQVLQKKGCSTKPNTATRGSGGSIHHTSEICIRSTCRVEVCLASLSARASSPPASTTVDLLFI